MQTELITFEEVLNTLRADDVVIKNLDETEANKAVGWICKGRQKITFIDENDLYEIFKSYLNDRNAPDTMTDQDNNINFMNFRNGLYIDIDYHIKTSLEDIEIFNKHLAFMFIQSLGATYKATYGIDNDEYYYFAFVPTVFKDDGDNGIKGGIHIMAFFNKTLTQSQALEFRNNMLHWCADNYQRFKLKNPYLIKYDTPQPDINYYELFSLIFDEGPVKSGNLLCPFGQKDKTSRRYKLLKSSYNGQNWFIKNSTQRQQRAAQNITSNSTKQAEIMKGINIIRDPPREPQIIEHANDESTAEEFEDDIPPLARYHSVDDGEFAEAQEMERNQEQQEQQEEPPEIIDLSEEIPAYTRLLCKTATLIYKFTETFKYLSSNHELWKDITNNQGGGHDKYYKKIVIPYIKILTLFNLWHANSINEFGSYYEGQGFTSNTSPEIIFDKITRLVANQMATLCRCKKSSPNDEHHRYHEIEQYKEIINYPTYKTFKNNIFGANTRRARQENNENSLTFSAPYEFYYFMKKFNFNFKDKTYLKLYGDYITEHKQIYNMLHSVFCAAFSEYSWFVCYIKDSLTNEIEPFNIYKSYYNQKCYKETNDEETGYRELLSFYDVEPDFDISSGSKKRIEDDDVNSVYSATLYIWFVVILTFRYYENCFQLQNAITETLGAFIKQYICMNNLNGSSSRASTVNKSVLIYNIRQTKTIETFPYNQWITDDGLNLISLWVTKLYNSYIKTCLLTTNKENEIGAIIQFLYDNKITQDITSIRKLKPFDNADKEIKAMVNNIIMVHPTESSNTPNYIPLETSPIFPMRNGWLYFRSGLIDVDKPVFINEKDDCYIHFEENNKENYTTASTNVIWVGSLDDYLKYINKEGNEKQKQAYEESKALI